MRVCKDCVRDVETHTAWALGRFMAGQEYEEPPVKPPVTTRPAPHPGPRCATHHRAAVKARKAAAHERSVQANYGLGAGDYQRLYRTQSGVCALCRRSNGRTRRLSVDHDHATGEVRGLLCRPCNDLLGHARDSVEFFQRCIDYLNDPPANEVLK